MDHSSTSINSANAIRLPTRARGGMLPRASIRQVVSGQEQEKRPNVHKAAIDIARSPQHAFSFTSPEGPVSGGIRPVLIRKLL